MPFVVETKLIKPKQLKIDDIRLELLNALRKEGTAIKHEYEKTVATWKQKPEFRRLSVSLRGGLAVIAVGTGDVVYKFVDEGTTAHKIVPKNRPFLAYQTVFVPKTKPNVIASNAGGKSGPWTRRKEVWHPGNAPRNFSNIIQKNRAAPFEKAMQAAMKRGADKANARGQA